MNVKLFTTLFIALVLSVGSAMAEAAVDTAAAAATTELTAMLAKVAIIAASGFGIWMIPTAYRKIKGWITKTT